MLFATQSWELTCYKQQRCLYLVTSCVMLLLVSLLLKVTSQLGTLVLTYKAYLSTEREWGCAIGSAVYTCGLNCYDASFQNTSKCVPEPLTSLYCTSRLQNLQTFFSANRAVGKTLGLNPESKSLDPSFKLQIQVASPCAGNYGSCSPTPLVRFPPLSPLLS